MMIIIIKSLENITVIINIILIDWNKVFRDQLNNTEQLLCNYNLYVYSWTNYCTEELNYFTIQQFKEHINT